MHGRKNAWTSGHGVGNPGDQISAYGTVVIAAFVMKAQLAVHEGLLKSCIESHEDAFTSSVSI